MAQTPNEIKIANESIKGITMEQTPNELKIADESINGIVLRGFILTDKPHKLIYAS
jgi:hypothetical protein